MALLAKHLREQGFRARGMREKRRALIWMLEHIPDLIITDLHSPDMDGFEFMRELRTHRLFKEIPVIMLTGNGQLGSDIEAIRLGVTNCLSKPYDLETLSTLVHKTIGTTAGLP